MQITLPDNPLLQKRAAAAGFETVEGYVLDLIEQEAEFDEERGITGKKQSYEEWSRDFREFLNSMRSHNLDFDDSRESIYPVR
ncbi:MAG: hypothetical protein WBC44_07195 [Planctomycetaceae bacterium]